MERAESAELARQLAALGPQEALSAYLRSDSTISLENEANKLLELADALPLLQLWETLLAHPLIVHFVQLPLVKQAFDRLLANQLKTRPAAAVLLSLANAAFYQAWLADKPQPLTTYYSLAVAGLVLLLPEPTELLAAFLRLAENHRLGEAYVFGLQFEMAELALAQHMLSPEVEWLRVAGFMWTGARWDAAEAVASELRGADNLLQAVNTFEAWSATLSRLGGPGRRLAVLLAVRWPGERCLEVAVSAAAGLSWMAGHQLARQVQAQRSPHMPYLLSRLSALGLTQPEATPYPWLPVALPLR